MDGSEKIFNENENTGEAVPATDIPAEQIAEAEPSAEAPSDSSLPVEAEPMYLSEAEAEAESPAVYRWTYGEQTELINTQKRERSRNSAIIFVASVTGAFLISFTVLVVLLLLNRFASEEPKIDDVTTPPTVITSERVVYVREYDSASGALTTQEIYNLCLPSVVSISVSNETAAGVGSGFIISEDGYIVTANHVIQDMTRVRVILSNGESYEATVIGGNEFTDLALLKIQKTGLTPIKIGRSSDLLVGDNVVAIGTPASIDFAGSLAEGNVSYNNRILKVYDDDGTVQKKMTLIQTNALVNPGNSGCPLINEYGEVVGIVTMKLNSTYYEGMCFAIPIDAAMPIINAMKNGQSYDSLLSAVSTLPAKLGISAQNVVMNNGTYGVRIDSFLSSEYDINSKMKKNDIIVSINNVSVSTVEDLSRILNQYNPGDTVQITFYRSSQTMTVSVKLSS